MHAGLLLTTALTLTAIGAGTASAQPSPWVPASVSTQVAIAKAVNTEATNRGGDAHSAGCFSALLVKKNKNLAAISLTPKANVAACGSRASFGIQVYARQAGVWVRIGGNPGSPGAACTWTKKATAAMKTQIKATGLCR